MAEYFIKVAQTADSKPTERLVRAKNEARAIKHVVKDSVIATVATTDDVIRLTAPGVKLELAD